MGKRGRGNVREEEKATLQSFKWCNFYASSTLQGKVRERKRQDKEEVMKGRGEEGGGGGTDELGPPYLLQCSTWNFLHLLNMRAHHKYGAQ
jgi:hypothetical protein